VKCGLTTRLRAGFFPQRFPDRRRTLITRGFGEHAAAMEDVAGGLSKNERLTLLRLLKKLGKYAAETRK